MRTAVLVVAFLGLAAPPPAAAEHPITGVITLLEKLEVETKQEGEAEAASFQKFQYWCKRSTRRLTRYIKKEKKQVEELTDKIGGLDSDISTLGEDIKKLEAQLEMLDQQKQRAKNIRQNEHGVYVGDVDNLDATITATDDTIHTMEEEEAAANAENAAFLQIGAKVRKIR